MSYFTNKHHKIYYEERGEGDPLLMIAGLASDSQSWLPVIVPLSKRFRLITIDNRGTGRSDSDNNDLTIDDLAGDVAALINHLGIEKVNILGHSMGGMIAMSFAVNYPELVDNLILVATTVKAGSRNIMLFNSWLEMLDNGMKKESWFKNIYYWLFTPSFFNDEQLVEQAVKMSLNYRFIQSDESFKNQIQTIVRFDFVESVAKLNARTLIMRGENDILFNKECTDDLSSVTNSHTVIIPDAAHSVHMDNPAAFIKEVTDFLSDEL